MRMSNNEETNCCRCTHRSWSSLNSGWAVVGFGRLSIINYFPGGLLVVAAGVVFFVRHVSDVVPPRLSRTREGSQTPQAHSQSDQKATRDDSPGTKPDK